MLDDGNDMSEERNEDTELQAGSPCPLCGRPLVERHSERGDFLGCSDFPACSYMTPLARHRTVQDVLPMSDLCPKCGSPLALKRGRFGLFVGCTNYPGCDFTYTGTERSEIKCPLCGKGTLAQRISGTGRMFYACSNYPDCTFSVPGKPVVRNCPKCSFPLMFEKKAKNGVKTVCGNSLCPSRKARRRVRKEIEVLEHEALSST